MHRLLALTLLASLVLACATESEPPAPPPEPFPLLVPEPPIEPIDEREEIRNWNCHPREVARLEFVTNEDRAPRETEPELARLVASWSEPPGPEGPVAKVLIMGWRSESEDESLDDARAERIRSALIEAGAQPSLLLAAGFDVASEFHPHDEPPNQTVTVLEVCGICCLL